MFSSALTSSQTIPATFQQKSSPVSLASWCWCRRSKLCADGKPSLELQKRLSQLSTESSGADQLVFCSSDADPTWLPAVNTSSSNSPHPLSVLSVFIWQQICVFTDEAQPFIKPVKSVRKPQTQVCWSKNNSVPSGYTSKVPTCPRSTHSNWVNVLSYIPA